ncbi:DUF6541 family protein [Carnobacterium sp. FSL W8-0810]|uniref:DUF6541 family protein n=1 Tax=Carnobacterium sp. FSL W8-0810 TaxID=2954705 RepID=UPI0030F776D8
MNFKKRTASKSGLNLAIIALFVFLSIFVLYFTIFHNGEIMLGDDLQFHKNRIEGLAEALRNHEYFPKVNMVFINTMGYASSIFYSDLFLYFPAILRVIGLSISETYILFIIAINFLTFIIAYISFFNVTMKQKNSLVFSLLYTLSTYRLLDITRRGAIGEVLALCFLPIAFMGLYHIIYGKPNRWYYLSIGMALIIYAHILSAIMLAFLILVFLLVNSKELLKNKNRITSFMKAVGITIPLVIGYFVPILEQMASQTFKVKSNPVVYISEKALKLGDIIFDALSNNPRPNMGILLIVFMFVYVFSLKKITSNSSKHFILLSTFFLILTTDLIPWRVLEQTFFNTIQFPWRFFTFVTLLTCWFIAEDSLNFFNNKVFKATVLIACVLFSFSYTINLRYQTDEKKMVTYNEFNKVDSYIIGSGLEYLPGNTDYDKLKTKNLNLGYDTENIDIQNYTKFRSTITFDFDTSSKQIVTLPLVYYKGYTSEFMGNGQVSKPYLNETEEGLASIAVEGKGTVTIQYKNTFAQNISLIVSIFSWIFLCVFLIFRKEMYKYYIISKQKRENR